MNTLRISVIALGLATLLGTGSPTAAQAVCNACSSPTMTGLPAACCVPPVEVCPPPPCGPVCGATCGACACASPPAPPRRTHVTRFRPELRDHSVVTYRTVPEVKNVEEPYTVMVAQTRTRTVEDVVNHPVYHDITLQTTRLVPHTETRQATRTVCRNVPVQEERTVCEVTGHWQSAPLAGAPAAPASLREEQVSPPPPPSLAPNVTAPAHAKTEPPPAIAAAPPVLAGACGGCETCSGPVWVPEVVQRKVMVTCMKPVVEQQPYEYAVTRVTPEVQSRTVAFQEFEPEKRTHEEQYTVYVPETRLRTRQVTVWHSVPEKRTEQYTAMVPYDAVDEAPAAAPPPPPQTAARPDCCVR
jgi:hypothetical protein